MLKLLKVSIIHKSSKTHFDVRVVLISNTSWDYRSSVGFDELSITHNRIYGVLVSVFASSVVDRGFEPRYGLAKVYQMGICCFSAKHAALMSR